MQGHRLHWAIVLILVVLALAWSTTLPPSQGSSIDEATWPTLTITPTKTRQPTSDPALSPTPTSPPTQTPILSPTPTPTVTPVATVLPPEYAFFEVFQKGGLIQGADVVGSYAYLRIGPRLAVLDVSDPAQPTLVGESEILPGPGQYSDTADIRRISLASGYAYLPNGTRGLAIMNVLDPTHPTQEGCYASFWPVWDAAVVGDLAYVAAGEAGVRVLDITSKAHPRAVGAYQTAGSIRVVEAFGDLLCVVEHPGTLHVLDISAPTEPRFLGEYSTDGLVYQVVLAGDHAYLRGTECLDILDLSDPSSPDPLAKLRDFSGRPAGFSGAVNILPAIPPSPDPVHDLPHAMAFQGGYLYRTCYGSRVDIYSVVDPANPVKVAELGLHGDQSRYQGIWVVSNYAYLQVKYSGERVGLCIVDVSDPASPILHGCYLTYETGSVKVAWPFACVSERGGISIVSIEDPAQPGRVGSYAVEVEPVAMADDYLYALNDGEQGMGLEIIDFTDPQHPSRAAFIPGVIRDVAVSDGHAYVAHWKKLMIINVTDPYSAMLTSEWGDLYSASHVAVGGGHVYLSEQNSSGGSSLYVLDVADPAQPLLLATVELHQIVDLVLAGQHLYVMDGPFLLVYSVVDPAKPVQVGSWTAGTYMYLHRVVGRRAYLTDTHGELTLLDVSNPAQPRKVLSWTTNGSAQSLDVYEDFVYVGDGEGGLLVLRLVHIEGRSFLPILMRTD